MAALTLTQLKTAYQSAISSTTIGQTFAIRDYLLYRIYENTYTSGGGSGVTETFTSQVYSDIVSPLVIAAGSVCVTIETDADFAGTINGIARQPSRSYMFRANYNSELPSFTVAPSSGSVNVDIQANP